MAFQIHLLYHGRCDGDSRCKFFALRVSYSVTPDPSTSLAQSLTPELHLAVKHETRCSNLRSFGIAAVDMR